MRNLSLWILFLCIVGCESDPSGTAITNVTVIDAVNGIRHNQTVVFDGDVITAIDSANVTVSAARHVDGSGKYLIPGLWDFHVHLTYDDRFTETMPAMFLYHGITSVRDTGGLMHKMLPLIDKLRNDHAIAPRVFFSGPLLDGDFVVYDGKSRPEIGVQNASAEQARAKITELKEQGIDFIKIYELVSPEVFESMVEVANELGLPIDSHVPLSMRAGVAGPVVDSIEHLRNIEMDCAENSPELHEIRLEKLKNSERLSGFELRSSLHNLQRLPAIYNYDEERCDRTLAALKDTIQVPTLRLLSMVLMPPYRRNDWADSLSLLPDEVKLQWQEGAEEQLNKSGSDPDTTYAEWGIFLTGRAHAFGVPIGAGTDTPIGLAIPGYSLHTEMEFLVRAGLSPIEALYAATMRPADFFSLQNDMGTVDVGKKADLVLLGANPLENIAHIRSVNAVVTKGRFIDRAGLSKLVSEAHGQTQ